MRPIKVALVHADHPRHKDSRMVGIWSYPVPEFEVTRFPQEKYVDLSRLQFQEFDVIFQEDARMRVTWNDKGDTPLIYYVVDSTLSSNHYRERRVAAEQADLVLVDWDRLERFAGSAPVRRLSHCVNDRMFAPKYGDYTTDVGFFFHHTPERLQLHEGIFKLCKHNGYTYQFGQRGGVAYAKSLARCKININLNRNPETRTHRCFDVMASRSCLLTSPLPTVSDELKGDGCYGIYKDGELETMILVLLKTSKWQAISNAGYELIQEHHTWAVRARQLADIIRHHFDIPRTKRFQVD